MVNVSAYSLVSEESRSLFQLEFPAITVREPTSKIKESFMQDVKSLIFLSGGRYIATTLVYPKFGIKHSRKSFSRGSELAEVLL